MRAEEHLSYRDGGRVFPENTFISSILKRDGHLNVGLISPDNGTIEKRVVNYLEHDMVNFKFISMSYSLYLSHIYLSICVPNYCSI